MSRPAGEPGVLAAGARSLAAGAAALGEVGGRLGGASSLPAAAWRGPASQAFLADGAELRGRLGRAAATLEEAAGALAELSARLEHAQATWDRAQRLAASVGVALDPGGDGWAPPPGRGPGLRGDAPASPFPRDLGSPGVRSPADAVDPAGSLLAGQALQLARAAEQEAAAARRVAAARSTPPPGGWRPPPAPPVPSPGRPGPAPTGW